MFAGLRAWDRQGNMLWGTDGLFCKVEGYVDVPYPLADDYQINYPKTKSLNNKTVYIERVFIPVFLKSDMQNNQEIIYPYIEQNDTGAVFKYSKQETGKQVILPVRVYFGYIRHSNKDIFL